MPCLVILAASIFELSCGKPDTQTNEGKNFTPATAVGVGNKSGLKVTDWQKATLY